jgi:hypothetical protein
MMYACTDRYAHPRTHPAPWPRNNVGGVGVHWGLANWLTYDVCMYTPSTLVTQCLGGTHARWGVMDWRMMCEQDEVHTQHPGHATMQEGWAYAGS